MSARKVRLNHLTVVWRTLSNSVSPVMLLPGIEDGLFKSLKWKQQDSDVEVFWDPINLREQSAFIQGYVLYCSGVNNDIDVNVSTGNVTPSYFLMMGHKLCYEGYTVHSVSHLLNLLHK